MRLRPPLGFVLLSAFGCRPGSTAAPPSSPPLASTPAELESEPAPEAEAIPEPRRLTPFERAEIMLQRNPTLWLRHLPPADDHALTILATDSTSTLCVSSTSRQWQQCFEGDWPLDGLYEALTNERTTAVCVSVWSGGTDTDWSFVPSGGPMRRGCEGENAAPASTPAPQPVEAIANLEKLGELSVMPLAPGTAMIQEFGVSPSDGKERLCWRTTAGLACEDVRSIDTDGVLAIEYGSFQAQRTSGAGWVAVQRSRTAEGGAEQWRGDDSLLLFRYDGQRLELYGVLPLGGHDGERFGEAYPDFTRVTTEVSSTAVLHASGCVTVKSTTGKTSRRTSGPIKERSHRAPRAEAWLSGEDVSVWDTDVVSDYAGSWMPDGTGGFKRAAGCSTQSPRRNQG